MVSGLERKRRFAIHLARAVTGAACALLAGTSPAEQDLTAKPVFTDSEIRIILSHGPWPAPAQSDPTNRVSGRPHAIEFGTRLFFDQRLSGKGTVACASCHVPERNWSDNLRRGVGMSEVDRNTPTLMNLSAGLWYGWDGASDSLWSQSLRPILDERELAATPRHVAQLVRNDEQLSCRYRKAFGTPPSPTDDEAVLVGVGKALAAFQETLVSGRTPFDRFRDALAGAERPPLGTYSEPAQRGLKIFIGKGGCTTCHSGPNFTGGEFFNTGLSRFAPRGQQDPGRRAGIRQLLESRFNLLGPYNDDRSGAAAVKSRHVALEHRNYGEFKVPMLRNVALTAPYMHNGSLASLAEVVRHYSELNMERLHADGESLLRPLRLSVEESSDLVEFLASLTERASALPMKRPLEPCLR